MALFSQAAIRLLRGQWSGRIVADTKLLASKSQFQRTSRCLSSSSSSTPSLKSKEIAIPAKEQLQILAFRTAIPMIGFGFMDNLVMITAGEAIDSTFGVYLGISTMTAAGFGQCFSDVAGITCGGAVDAGVSRLRLPKHGLSQEQLDLRRSRMYSTFGACVGVLTGCLLGMSCLVFMDTDRADRAKKAKELQSIFETIMDEGADQFNAERATLFMLDNEKKELWSRVATGTEGIIQVPANAGIVGACVSSGEIINIIDAYNDDRFNHDVDARTGFHTKSILAIPVKDEDGKIIGAIQMCNKKNSDGSDSVFSDNDEKLLQMLASHVTSFIKIVNAE